MDIQRNYGPERIERPSNMSYNDSLRSGTRSVIRGVEGVAKYLAKQGIKEGTRELPKIGEIFGTGFAVGIENPELAPAFAWAGKEGGKYLQRKANIYVDSF